MTVEEQCFSFRSSGNVVNHCEEKPRSTIMVQANDTDILMILLENMHKLSNKIVFMTNAFDKNDERHNINCTELASVRSGPLKSFVGFPRIHRM